MAKPPAIGELRWPVTVYRRDMAPDARTGIDEILVPIADRRAKIEASRPVTFYGSAQTDAPVTHFIWLRWLDYPATTWVVVRPTRRPDGTLRTETFRVRRAKEMDGRKRFLEIEAELERVS